MHSKRVISPQLAHARCKTCPFICNVEKLSGPKRSIKITDHLTCTSTNVIYCITCSLCKTLYISETVRQLGNRFREHLCDVEKDDKTHLNRSPDTLICPIILSNIWYRKHQRISHTFLLKIFVSNRGCGLSARTSVHHAVHLHKLTLFSENFTAACV